MIDSLNQPLSEVPVIDIRNIIPNRSDHMGDQVFMEIKCRNIEKVLVHIGNHDFICIRDVWRGIIASNPEPKQEVKVSEAGM